MHLNYGRKVSLREPTVRIQVSLGTPVVSIKFTASDLEVNGPETMAYLIVF